MPVSGVSARGRENEDIKRSFKLKGKFEPEKLEWNVQQVPKGEAMPFLSVKLRFGENKTKMHK